MKNAIISTNILDSILISKGTKSTELFFEWIAYKKNWVTVTIIDKDEYYFKVILKNKSIGFFESKHLKELCDYINNNQ